MNVLGILQARMSSTRLPGKVLKPLLGEPMLARQIERIRRAGSLDLLILATSTGPEDDAVEVLAASLDMPCFRGSLDDVADRIYQAAQAHRPAHVLKLAGDSPLTDPGVLDGLVRFHVDGGFDYSTNGMEPTWPDGLDGEVFTFDCLERVWREATQSSEREHLVPYFLRHPDAFHLGHYRRDGEDLSHMRWTVDEAEDFDFVTRIYETLYPANPSFTTEDVLDLISRAPDLLGINAGKERNAGRAKSMAADGVA